MARLVAAGSSCRWQGAAALRPAFGDTDAIRVTQDARALFLARRRTRLHLGAGDARRAKRGDCSAGLAEFVDGNLRISDREHAHGDRLGYPKQYSASVDLADGRPHRERPLTVEPTCEDYSVVLPSHSSLSWSASA